MDCPMCWSRKEALYRSIDLSLSLYIKVIIALIYRNRCYGISAAIKHPRVLQFQIFIMQLRAQPRGKMWNEKNYFVALSLFAPIYKYRRAVYELCAYSHDNGKRYRLYVKACGQFEMLGKPDINWQTHFSLRNYIYTFFVNESSYLSVSKPNTT